MCYIFRIFAAKLLIYSDYAFKFTRQTPCDRAIEGRKYFRD